MNAATDARPAGLTRPLRWDFEAIRNDFPVLHQRVHDAPLAYLDNAATSQKPALVIDTIADFYRHDNANVHRAVHTLAERATTAYEAAREHVRRFINASNAGEIVFLRGTTEAIKLIANTLGQGWQPGDRVLLTTMEHHANIVPRQLLRERTRRPRRHRRSTPLPDARQVRHVELARPDGCDPGPVAGCRLD